MPDDFEEYDSGPYCRHFGDPSDCDEVCAKCGHECAPHGQHSDCCNVSGCECDGFADEAEVLVVEDGTARPKAP